MRSVLGVEMACAAFMVMMFVAMTATAAPSSSLHGKQRTTRGFKNAALSTARGFGKRGGFFLQDQEPLTDLFARIHRPKTQSSQQQQQETDSVDPLSDLYLRAQNIDTDSIPVDWFADEVTSNPELARLLVGKLMDRNQDGELSVEEMLRPTY